MSISFQPPVTSVMEGIIDFHNDIQFYLIVIITFVAWSLFSIVHQFGFALYPSKRVSLKSSLQVRRDSLVLKQIAHGTLLEIIWTILPVLVLVAIAVPSFALLYSIDEVVQPSLTVKIMGSQWFWNYEYTDTEYNFYFESYIVPEPELYFGTLRLLEVNARLLLPVKTHIRLLVTATDVLHSWAVPALGIKMDCVPGRLNQVTLYFKKGGTFFGQCSELCGVNHGFMPIGIITCSPAHFERWREQLFPKFAFLSRFMRLDSRTMKIV